MEFLELCNNYLETINPGIAALCNLRALDISRNPFKSFPDAVCLLKRLEELHASGCSFTTLPSSFASLNQLGQLTLDANAFEVFPEVICECKSLRYLSLTRNKLAELPRSFAKLQALIVLYLGENRFKAFPLAICEIKTLCSLFLRDNHLSELPLTVSKLCNLQDLNVAGNDLPGIPLFLGDLPRLHYLAILGQRGFRPAERYLDEVRNVLNYIHERCVIPRLTSIVACGFYGDAAWSRFLLEGLYDPRLFLVVFDFAFKPQVA